MHFSSQFPEAANDYLFLLERNYSQKSILKLVGDKFQLTGQERSMLYRGIVSRNLCRLRKQKLIQKLPTKSKVFIDGYNVIRTVGSYLLGKPLFISMDGLLRDASEMHSATLKQATLDKTISLLFEYLKETGLTELTILLDSPISKSGTLALFLNNKIEELHLKGKAKTLHSPDHHLKQVEKGIICTSDSSIIDESEAKVFDLARVILESNYRPELINFQELIK